MSRKTRITRYVQEWHGGVWSLGTVPAARVGLETRVATNVLSYFGIAETPANVANYSAAYLQLVEDGRLVVDQQSGGWLYLETTAQTDHTAADKDHTPVPDLDCQNCTQCGLAVTADGTHHGYGDD